jgi:hypothetical protein
MLITSIQFCLGTVDRTLRCFRGMSYTPESRLRRIGCLQGFKVGSEQTSRSRRDRADTLISVLKSVSDRIAEISSTGRDSNVDGMMEIELQIPRGMVSIAEFNGQAYWQAESVSRRQITW